jgi:NTE family protein
MRANSSQTSESADRGSTGKALVLGGGGVTGIAWEIGLLYGLSEVGMDLTQADLLVGTSAGSVVGAMVASGVPLRTLFEEQCAPASGEIAARLGPGALLWWLLTLGLPGNRQRARARLGHAALRARTVPEAQRRAVIERRLPSAQWPERRLLITAVEAETGAAAIFERASGVPLVDAVAASCAVPLVWPPITIGGRHYVDGGVRSTANVDLARGFGRVVVLAPVHQALHRAERPSVQAASLGPTVRWVVISPDATARAAIGSNVLDPAHRAAAAAAGQTQAASVVDQVQAVWY